MNIFSPKNTGVAGNLWKMVLMYSTNKRTYISFLSIFLLLMPDTTAQTVGFITALGSFCGFIFEVPSGYFSDKMGHKNALILAKVSLFVSTLCYVLASSITYFIVGAVFFALGLAMLSGTSSTFLKESLDHLGRGDEYSKISGKIRSVGFMIPIIFIILLPILAEQSYRLAFFIALVIDSIGLITALFLTAVPKKEIIKEFNLIKADSVLKQYFKIGWLPYVIFIELIYVFHFVGNAGFKNPFQEEIGFSVSMLGILWASSRFFISGLLLLSGWLKKNLTFKKLIIIQGLGYTLSFFGAVFFQNKWLVAASIVFGTVIAWGLSSVKSHFYLDYIGDSKYKASFLSINTFFQRVLSTFGSLLMGYLVLHYGYRFGFSFFGIAILLTVILAFFILKRKRN